ncbi:MAG: LysR substrate-binding domain-containing protein [Nibricoccus sp.]
MNARRALASREKHCHGGALMELRHLRYFQAVAETLNFSRAAERLHVAQPALSRQIKDLEDELGAPLFERNRVRVKLTDAGRELQTHVVTLLAAVETAVTATRAVARGASGELILCNDWKLSVDLIPQTVMAFRARYPGVDVTLAELPVHEQAEALRAGKIHLGFLPRHSLGAREDLDVLTVVESEFVAVLPVKHPLAGRQNLKLRELKLEKWVVMDGKIAPGHAINLTQLCRLAGFTPDFSKTAASLPGLLMLIASGFGVCLLPKFLLPASDSLLSYAATDCAPFELCAVWRKGDGSRLLSHYIDILREHRAVRNEE